MGTLVLEPRTPLSFYKQSVKLKQLCLISGLPDSSEGKESARNAGDPGLIPGLGRFTGEEIGYRLQYSWASLVV